MITRYSASKAGFNFRPLRTKQLAVDGTVESQLIDRIFGGRLLTNEISFNINISYFCLIIKILERSFEKPSFRLKTLKNTARIPG
jgi:hypothetical protein